MLEINWEPSMSVGVEEIDKQHKKLLDLINDLNESIKTGKTEEQLKDILKALKDFAITHFATEEKYFDKFNFKDAAKHKEEHQNFFKALDDFFEKHEQKGDVISFELVEFLIHWLETHLKDMDQKYVECFKANGLK